MRCMAQLTINKRSTASRCVIELAQDPHDIEDPVTVTARVYAVDGSVLAASSVNLYAVEADFLDTLVQDVVNCWRWGAPQSQLVSMMRYRQREARRHARAHGGR